MLLVAFKHVLFYSTYMHPLGTSILHFSHGILCHEFTSKRELYGQLESPSSVVEEKISCSSLPVLQCYLNCGSLLPSESYRNDYVLFEEAHQREATSGHLLSFTSDNTHGDSSGILATTTKMHLRAIEQKDIPDFAQVCGLAMWKDEIMEYTAPRKNQYPTSYFQHVLYRVRLRWYRGEYLFLCVTDENDSDWTGQETVMGYCGYSTTLSSVKRPVRAGWLGNGFESFATKCFGWWWESFRLNWSADHAAEKHFRSAIAGAPFKPYFDSLPDEHKAKYADQHWELEILGTHPGYRRRGVGKTMLQWGFDRASLDGLPLILIASVMGEKLYLSTGFRELDRIDMVPSDPASDAKLKELDLGMGKGKGLTWAAMVWEPSSMSPDDGEDQPDKSK